MARRVIIRSRDLNTDVAQLEEMIKADYKEIWKQHQEDLQAMADRIVSDAQAVVPLDTGKLQQSIKARVSKSNRYPGLIVQASAKKKGFDYALIQEENEMFSHDVGRTAHYLGGTFARVLDLWYYQRTKKNLNLPPHLQEAVEFVENAEEAAWDEGDEE